MALFTTTSGLYGGVLWSGELQGCTAHEIMKQCLMPSAIRSQKPEEVEEAAALVALLAAPSHHGHGARRTAHSALAHTRRIQHTARQRPALRAGSVLCRSVAVAVALRAAACGWRLRLRLRLRRTANCERTANWLISYLRRTPTSAPSCSAELPQSTAKTRNFDLMSWRGDLV
jgi:hypothetical protein